MNINAKQNIILDIGRSQSGSSFIVRDQLNDSGASANRVLLRSTGNSGIALGHITFKNYSANTEPLADATSNNDVFGDGDAPDSALWMKNNTLYASVGGQSFQLAPNGGVNKNVQTSPSASSGEPVYLRDSGSYFDFATVGASTGISVSTASDVITITNTDRGSQTAKIGTVAGDSGSFSVSTNNDTLTIAGGTNITTSVTGTTLTVNGPTTTSAISEGSNLYYTNARADARADVRIAAADTDDLSEGSTNLYYTDARARGAISVSGDLSYDNSTGVISFTNDAGDIESVTAGDGLQGGGTSGAVSLAVDSSVVRTSGAQTIAGVKTFSSGAIFNNSITGPGTTVLFDASGKLDRKSVV